MTIIYVLIALLAAFACSCESTGHNDIERVNINIAFQSMRFTQCAKRLSCGEPDAEACSLETITFIDDAECETAELRACLADITAAACDADGPPLSCYLSCFTGSQYVEEG